MKEIKCSECCVCAFKESLCGQELCEKYARGGSADDFEKLLAEERKTGKWVHLGGDEWCCDKCGFVITTEGSWEHPHDIGAKYCQNCGAKTEE